MEIIIIYDNTLYSILPGLRSDWGFATLISAHGKHILFDAGANGRILLDNMRILGIDPMIISDIFISHNHFDHIGGLSHFLNVNNNVIVHSPPSFRGVKNVRKVKYYKNPEKIYKGFYSSGEIKNIEQSIGIDTDEGLFVITGCSHPEMKKILNSFSRFGNVKGIAGGFHDFKDFNILSGLDIIAPMHCTKHVNQIKKLFPDQYMIGGVGRTFRL